MAEQEEQHTRPGPPPGPEADHPLAPLADDLVRLLGFVLAGGFVLSALTLAACRLQGAGSGMGGTCSELVPSLEAKHQQALDVLLTLLAGAGLGRMR